MTLKNRLAQLEKQQPPNKMTWREFIESDPETWDPATRAAWAEFIADEIEATDETTQPITAA